jgi:RND family efflux transporter MFP subunit
MVRLHNTENVFRRKRTGVIASLLFVLLASSLLLSGCKEKVKPGAAEVKRQAVSGVVVAEILPSRVDEYYETSGTVKARATSVIASRVMGTITSVKVREGDRVRAGQVLMTLDDRDVAQKVAAAEKTVEAAKQNQLLMDVTYQRYKKLHEEKALTQQEIDQVTTQKKVADIEYERAGAGLAEAKIFHGFTSITAPFAGAVTEKKIDAGSMAVPGMPLLVLEDTSSFRIEANADERLSARLKPGMPVEIVVESVVPKIEGRISEIVPAIDPMSRTFLIKVEMKASGLKSGLYAKLRIPVGTREALLVPKTAVLERGQLTGVYTVDDRSVITYRLVRTGKAYENAVEILSGINAKEKVITSGIEKAVDGGVLVNAPENKDAPPARER